MSLKYIVTYKVTGSGEFPFDMLRYDRSSPMSELPDSYQLIWSSIVRTVQLICYIESPHVRKNGFQPCVKRWESFGWKVSDILVEKMR